MKPHKVTGYLWICLVEEDNMKADPKFSEGARLERDAMRDYLRRKIKKLWDNTSERETLEGALNWLLARQKRYDKQEGGLGKK